jgi:hypothetical protein
MDEEQRWAFDLDGYIVCEGALATTALRELNAALDVKVGSHPMNVTSQYSSTTLYQVSYHIQ